MTDTVRVPRAWLEAFRRDTDPTEPIADNGGTVWDMFCHEAIAMLAASPSVGGWEDISTAPKDGSKIAVRHKDGREMTLWANPEWEPEASRHYTHWMPLPPPVSTGSRPQEAVPTEGLSRAVLVWERDEAVALLRRIVETKNDAYDAEVEALAIRAFLAALSTPQPVDGCSSNEGAGK